MNEANARSILGDWVQEENDNLIEEGHGTIWCRRWSMTADCPPGLTPDQLEAIAWWMRNKGIVNK